jgi:transcriptional regulator with XRE-family HTH domain
VTTGGTVSHEDEDPSERRDADLDDHDGFAAALKMWREAGKMSRTQLGGRLAEMSSGNWGANHIRLWEQGRAQLPERAAVAALARAVGVDLHVVADTVGWERVRRGAKGATAFVRGLVERAKAEARATEQVGTSLSPQEAALLLAIRQHQERVSFNLAEAITARLTVARDQGWRSMGESMFTSDEDAAWALAYAVGAPHGSIGGSEAWMIDRIGRNVRKAVETVDSYPAREALLTDLMAMVHGLLQWRSSPSELRIPGIFHG